MLRVVMNPNLIEEARRRSVRFRLDEVAVTQRMSQCILQIFDKAIGAEQPIPEEIDHRKIAVPIAVVDEMELLLSSEPGKAAKP